MQLCEERAFLRKVARQKVPTFEKLSIEANSKDDVWLVATQYATQVLLAITPAFLPMPSTTTHSASSLFLESRFFVWNVQGMKERYKCRSVSNFGNCAWKNGSFAATLSYAKAGLICNKPAIPFTVFCFHLDVYCLAKFRNVFT